MRFVIEWCGLKIFKQVFNFSFSVSRIAIIETKEKKTETGLKISRQKKHNMYVDSVDDRSDKDRVDVL